MDVWVRNLCCPVSTHIMSGLSSIDTVDTIKARYEARGDGHAGGPAADHVPIPTGDLRNGSRLAD
jgi:hypothetical protein